jgi:signal peptidase II
MGPWARAGVTLAGVVALDQVTKALVRSHVAVGHTDSVFFGVDLVHVRNTGVAFGALSGGGILVLLVTAIALIALVAYFATHPDRPGLWLPTGLLVGGAVGNVIDRIDAGAVTDFIKLPHWPAFNVADMAITVGVLALIYVLERPRQRRRA